MRGFFTSPPNYERCAGTRHPGGRGKVLNVAVGSGKASKFRMIAGIATVVLTIEPNLSAAIKERAAFVPDTGAKSSRLQ